MSVPVLVLDGGLGTSLERKYGVKFGPSTPLWSSHLLVTEQDTLARCQKDFGDVPVDIILTATYQVSIEGFASTRTAEHPDGIPKSQIPQYIENALTIAERAKQKNAHVALSIGPYGACMIPSQEYSGEYDLAHSNAQSLETWHTERLRLFASTEQIATRVSYISLETIPRLDEIKALRRSLDAVAGLATIPFWISCLFPGDNYTLPCGASVQEALQAVFDPEVASSIPWGVGINCTKVWKLNALLHMYESTISSMVLEGRIATWPALVLYPDGTNGEVYNVVTQMWELSESKEAICRPPWDEQLADIVKGTTRRGQWASVVVGGCCMAGAEDIRRLRQRLK